MCIWPRRRSQRALNFRFGVCDSTLKSVRIGSTPVLKIALPSSPLPEHRTGPLDSLAGLDSYAPGVLRVLVPTLALSPAVDNAGDVYTDT